MVERKEIKEVIDKLNFVDDYKGAYLIEELWREAKKYRNRNKTKPRLREGAFTDKHYYKIYKEELND